MTAPLLPSTVTSQHPPDDSGDQGPNLFAVLANRWPTVLLVFCLAAPPAIVASWLLVVPIYSSTRSIWVRPNVTPLVFKTVETGETPRYQSFLENQAATIMDSRVLDSPQLVDRINDRKVAWLVARPQGPIDRRTRLFMMDLPDLPLERLRSRLAVTPRASAELIDVAVTAPKADDAAFLANAIVDAYITVVVDNDQAKERKRYDQLAQAQKDLFAELTDLRMQQSTLIDSLPEEIRTADWSSSQAAMAGRFQQLSDQLTTARLTRAKVMARLKMMDERMAVASTQPATATRPGALVDPTLRDLRGRLAELEMERRLKVEVEGLLPQSDTVVRLDMKVADVRKRVDEAETAMRGMFPGVRTSDGQSTITYEELQAQLTESEMQIKVLDEAIARARDYSNTIRRTAQLMQTCEQKMARAKEDYDAVTRKIEQALIEQKAAPAKVEAGSKAIAASKPIKDRRVPLTVVSLFGSFGLAVIIAYLRERADSSVKAPAEVRLAVSSPVLGVLPQVADLPALPTVTDSVFAEEMRIVRTSLLSRLGAAGRSTSLLVTSCEMGTGKTTVSSYLAVSLAEANKRVLLVDADLRRRDLAQRWGAISAPGLSELLAGDGWVGAKDVIQKTALPRVDLVAAGAYRNGGGLMGRGNMAGYIAAWKQAYDVVILDGPPLLGVADAQMLVGMADHTVLSLKASRTRREDVQEACNRISNMNGSLIGIVLNAVSPQYHYYQRYQYYRPLDEASEATAQQT